MIGPFSTTLVPLSSSSSVDRQVLINVEASAISPDERTFGFIFTKIPFTRRSDEEKKESRSLDRIARTFSLFAQISQRKQRKQHIHRHILHTLFTYVILSKITVLLGDAEETNCWIKSFFLSLCTKMILLTSYKYGWTPDVTWIILTMSLLCFWALIV